MPKKSRATTKASRDNGKSIKVGRHKWTRVLVLLQEWCFHQNDHGGECCRRRRGGRRESPLRRIETQRAAFHVKTRKQKKRRACNFLRTQLFTNTRFCNFYTFYRNNTFLIPLQTKKFTLQPSSYPIFARVLTITRNERNFARFLVKRNVLQSMQNPLVPFKTRNNRLCHSMEVVRGRFFIKYRNHNAFLITTSRVPSFVGSVASWSWRVCHTFWKRFPCPWTKRELPARKMNEKKNTCQPRCCKNARYQVFPRWRGMIVNMPFLL